MNIIQFWTPNYRPMDNTQTATRSTHSRAISINLLCMYVCYVIL